MQCLYTTLEKQLAFMDDAYMGDHFFNFAKQVAGDEDGLIVFTVKPDQQFPDLNDAIRVEAIGRFI